MKRIVTFFLAVVTAVMFFGISVFAEDTFSAAEEELSGITIPENAQEFIDDNDIGISEPDGVLELTPMAVIKAVWEEFLSALAFPLKMLASLIAVILVSSVMGGMGVAAKIGGMSRIYGVVGALVSVIVVSECICTCVLIASETLSLGGDFLLSYVPVFTGIIAACGGISTAAGYQLTVIAIAEIFTQTASQLLMPMMTLCFCLAVVEAINPTVSLSTVIEGIKKLATFLIGLFSTVFTGVLTLRSVVGTSADTLTVKVGKYMTSNLVPIVGNAVSDAYSTLRSSFGILRGGAGAFGIIVIVMTMLPALMSVAATMFCVFVGRATADLFAVKYISTFLKSVGDILAVVMSLLISFTMLFVISTAVVMTVGTTAGGA